jgi:hypothetical protein
VFHTHSPTLNIWNTSGEVANIGENITEIAENWHIELSLAVTIFDAADIRLTPVVLA